MYERELQNLGLSEKEAKVYLTALELGADTAQNIAKKAGVNRATTYVQIDSLKQKGLITEFEKGKKTFYVAESPQRLESLFKTFEAELEIRKGELDQALPALLEMFAGMGERPKVRYFEGREGLNHMKADFSKIKTREMYSIINRDKIREFTPHMKEDYIDFRVANKIPIKVIYTKQGGPDPTDKDAEQYRESKFIDYDKFPLNADITIYDEKVVMASYGTKIIGIIIESQQIANALKAIFMNLWERL